MGIQGMRSLFASVAWLDFPPFRSEWRKIDGVRVSGGERMLTEILDAAGIVTTRCLPQHVDDHDVILVSLQSELDALAFRAAVMHCPDWRRRSATVIVGGFGLINPHAVADLADVGYWGRAEDEIVALVDDALAGRHDFDSPHILRFSDGIGPVTASQPTTLYDGHFVEEFVGCPMACKFCHYTHARKHLGGNGAFATREDGKETQQYLSTMYGDHGTPSAVSAEVTWPLLIDWPEHLGWRPWVKAGLDGCSERIRWLFGKRITADQVQVGMQAVIDRLDARGTESSGGKLSVYDIAFPAESDSDREELHDIIRSLRPPRRSRFSLNLHVTPFKPAPWTPMTWEAFEMRDVRTSLGGRYVRQDGIWANYDRFIESPAAQIAHASVTRCNGSLDAMKMLNAIALNGKIPGLKPGDEPRSVAESLFGVEQVAFALDDHPPEVTLPGDIARGKAHIDSLRRVAGKMRDAVERSGDAPSWRRGRRDLLGVTAV